MTKHGTQNNPFLARTIRQDLLKSAPSTLWQSSRQVLQHVLAWSESAVPVAVMGSASYEFDEAGIMQRAATHLGKMLARISSVVLLTGGMPAVGQDASFSFCDSADPARLIQVRPEELDAPDDCPGKLLIMGRRFEERQIILGMSCRIAILVGGGPGATREANVTLQNGGVVLPITSTGGAAGGACFETDDPFERQLNIDAAGRQAVRLGFDEYRWETITDIRTSPERAVRMIYQSIFEWQLCA